MTKKKKLKIILPKGFPKDLTSEVEKLANEIFVSEALKNLEEKEAQVFWKLVRDKKEFTGAVYEYVQNKKPGLLENIFKKIKKQVEKIIKYKVEIVYE